MFKVKAGKMIKNNKKLSPDLRNGLITIEPADEMIRFLWTDTDSLIVEDEYFLLKNDCVFQKVSQCTTGRVFSLSFDSSKTKYFYWIQDSAVSDEFILKSANGLLRQKIDFGSLLQLLRNKELLGICEQPENRRRLLETLSPALSSSVSEIIMHPSFEYFVSMLDESLRTSDSVLYSLGLKPATGSTGVKRLVDSLK